MLAGAAPFETFVQMIDEEIERAATSRASTSSAAAKSPGIRAGQQQGH
jgi:hypothetical protein